MEYAQKAVDNSGTAIGIRCKDGIVLAVEKLVPSKLLVPKSNRRILTADRHIGIATAGLFTDARHLVNRIRSEAQSYKDMYKSSIPSQVISERVAQYVQAYTLYSSVRPFGICTILGVVDRKGPSLYMIEPSGLYFGYHGCAVGKGKQLAKTEIEKLKLGEITCREAIKEAARIIYTVHDDVKDKEFELELSWICDESNNIHQYVPEDLAREAEEAAKASTDEDEEEDEEDQMDVENA